MAKATTAKEACKVIRDVLATPGVWAQGDDADPSGDCLCIVTAISERNGIPTELCLPTRALICDTINVQHGFMAIIAWNDEPYRTLEEVLAMLDKAAS